MAVHLPRRPPRPRAFASFITSTFGDRGFQRGKAATEDKERQFITADGADYTDNINIRAIREIGGQKNF